MIPPSPQKNLHFNRYPAARRSLTFTHFESERLALTREALQTWDDYFTLLVEGCDTLC
jgi:hypothetical protein